MKQTLLISLIFIFSSTFGQVDNYDLLTKNIESSNIHFVTKYRESKKFPNGEKKFRLEFNQKRQLVTIEEFEYPMGPVNPIVMRQEIKYNEAGKKVAIHIIAPGGRQAVDTLIYSDKGDLIKKQRIANGEVVRTWDYNNKKKDDGKKEFDSNGKLIKITKSDGDFTTYSYDSNGNMTQELQFQEGEEHTKYTFEYDDKGQLTKLKTYLLYIGDGTKPPLIYYFEYDEFE